jgi:hypothetical protein
MSKQQTENYKFDYFSRGTGYSATSDFRRFVTLDYNLESYIGVVGVGIIDGWDIESVSGTTIKILPGTGIIDGYAVESDYLFKQRSDMVSGEREIEEIHDTTKVYPPLEGSQRTDYIAIVKEYDPDYDPPENIENCFVKVVIPYQITLLNNRETFIYAKLPSSATPYPISADYPVTNIIRPKDIDYTNYADYKSALNTYMAQINVIKAYEWRANSDNHFNRVDFITSYALSNLTDRILLGKVITADGDITKIDVSKVNSLKDLETAINNAAKELVSSHVHGGNSYFDPQKIKLETDIRKIYLRHFNPETKVAIFDVPETSTTSLVNAHKHTYKLVGTSGYTIETIGSIEKHFHKITQTLVSGVLTWVVGKQEISYSPVSDHSHTVPKQDVVGGWNVDSDFIVSVNDIQFGDNNNSNISSDVDKKTITLYNSFGPVYRTYSSKFTVAGTTEEFSFVQKAYSVLDFISQMIKEFNNKYKNTTLSVNEDGTLNVDKNPFLFTGETEKILDDFEELYDQCAIAQYALNNVGDGFTFVPNAAKNIAIILIGKEESDSDLYEAGIEILGNTEVTGVLRLENIIYLNPKKIKLGTIEPERIPFISHIGRMGELAIPTKYPLVSSDGIEYVISPERTEFNIGHNHKLFLNKTQSGVTTQTSVDNEPVYYTTNSSGGKSYFVYHVHAVKSGNVEGASSVGLMDWALENSNSSTWITNSTNIIPDNTETQGQAQTLFSNFLKAKNENYVGQYLAGSISTDDAINISTNIDQNGNLIDGTFTKLNASGIMMRRVAISSDVENQLRQILENYKAVTNSSNPTVISTTASNTSTHTHTVLNPDNGDANIVYSVREVADGTIFAGTSSGVIVIPIEDSYSFTANNELFYVIGNNLWDLLLEVKVAYEKRTGEKLTVTTDIYQEQINLAEKELLSSGDSYIMYGEIVPERGQDTIMIKKCDYFTMPNFRNQRKTSNLAKGDYLIDIEFKSLTSGQTISYNEMLEAIRAANTYGEQEVSNVINSVSTIFVVSDDINDFPVWSMDLKQEGNGYETIVMTSSKFCSTNYDVQDDFYKAWKNVEKPLHISEIRKSFCDSNNNIWAATNSGVLVLRSYVFNSAFYENPYGTFSLTSNLGVSKDAYDITEGEVGSIYCATDKGIFTTTDGGYLWTNVFYNNSECLQILRDYKNDKTDNNLGHYHPVITDKIGNGIAGPSIGSGSTHAHSISSWIVGYTDGHNHTISPVLYIITSNDEIYKTTDGGTTWDFVNYLPNGENGDVIVFNSLISVPQKNNLYLLQSGKWNKVLDKTVYSSSFNYDMDGILLGTLNGVYSTSDFATFNLEMTFSGKPDISFYQDDQEQKFGYSYNNKINSLFFKNFTYEQSQAYALADFNKWFFERGQWNKTSKYDIFIDNKLVLSTQKNIDKREELGYHFDVIPEEGAIYFGAITSAIGNVSVYDDSILVEKTNGFYANDQIIVKSKKEFSSPSVENILEEIKKETPKQKIISKTNLDLVSAESVLYANVSGVTSEKLMLNERSNINISLPIEIKKIPSVDSNTLIKINIYESPLMNAGVLSHEELEDALSYKADGNPYYLENALVSNIMQLTQALRFVYPTINSEFKNLKIYDFNYSYDPLSPYYIGKEVDLLNCDVYNFSMFLNNFYNYGGKKINRIIFGTGTFTGNIIVATDVGLFWSKIENGLEGNWFHIKDMSMQIYDIIIFSNKLFCCTEDGTYVTADMITFDTIKGNQISFPSYKATLRWKGRQTVSVAGHTATFMNGYGFETNVGSIVSTTAVYGNLESNRQIKISNIGDLSGVYNIKEVVSSNHILTHEMFDISNPITYSNVVIEMGSWWEYLNGEVSTNDPNITNTLTIGGKDKISFCSNASSLSWNESLIPEEMGSFIVSDICPVDNGTAIASTISNSDSNPNNYLLYNSDMGNEWKIYKSFENINGKVNSSSLTDFNHSKIDVSYFANTSSNIIVDNVEIPLAQTSDLESAFSIASNVASNVTFSNVSSEIYVDGNLTRKNIAFFITGQKNIIYSGKIIWNEKDSKHYIYTFGSEATSIFAENYNKEIEFVIYPEKINSIAELADKTMIYGTDIGLFTDMKSYNYGYFLESSISKIGDGGFVSRIDMPGIIKSASKSKNNQVQFSIKVDDTIVQNSLIGYYLYITDLNNIERYLITQNGSTLSNGEAIIEINSVYSSNSILYSGKRIVIKNKNFSRVYVPISLCSFNQYVNGFAYIVTNGANLGRKYLVVNQTSDYIDVYPNIIPSSTITGSISTTGLSTGLKVGESVSLVDATGKLTLYTKYDTSIEPNMLEGMNMTMTMLQNQKSEKNNNITIYTNDINKIILNSIYSSGITSPLYFTIGDTYAVKGILFYPNNKFNSAKTSISEDHWHSTNIIGANIYGEIDSVTNINNAFVDIAIKNSPDFNNSIVTQRTDLFKEATISFYNKTDKIYNYKTKIFSNGANTIRVYIGDIQKWDFTNISDTKISEDWAFEIKSFYYGYTINTTYKDFIIKKINLTSRIEIGDEYVYVLSTTGISAGDRIKISNEQQKQEENYVDLVIDGTTIKLKESTEQQFTINSNPFIEVLSNTFTNTHVHQIRNNQVETVYVADYVATSYESNHSHEVIPNILSISKILENNGRILVVGSDNNIYVSYDNGTSWKRLIDLNVSLGVNKITNVTEIIANSNNQLIVGTNNGYILTEIQNTDIVPLEKPYVNI